MASDAPPAPGLAEPLKSKLLSIDVGSDGGWHTKTISGSSFDESPDSYDSRTSSPDSIRIPQSQPAQQLYEKSNGEAGGEGAEAEGAAPVGVGRLPDEVYARVMSSWRASIRKMITASIAWESEVLGSMQERVRTPFLDAYFVYTSSLGTHTFFMTVLPALFFFGYPEIGRGLLVVLGFGVYASSFVKDLVCSPRPFVPPVSRLTIGDHHLEYGFPSTHSTNSVSIALYLFSIFNRLYNTPAGNIAMELLEETGERMISQTTYFVALAVLAFYVFSIVFGRLYTGMHSFTDCTFGVLLGTTIWALHVLAGPFVDELIRECGWIVPAVTIPLGLFMVHRHPQPVDDCPCFEDAIAFVSVLMGEFTVRWLMLHNGYDERFFKTVMPGSSWATYTDVFAWFSVAAIKMILGILIIFAWRILAKSTFHIVLPPIFRGLAQLFTLPRRRFYTPATDYTSVPPEKGLRPIPSVIDLPSMLEVDPDVPAATSARSGAHTVARSILLRSGRKKGETGKTQSEISPYAEKEPWASEGQSLKRDAVKHYDADVLTKVFVYCGIGVLATGVIPIMFEILGWGVRTS